jgi:hypothetical protein
MGKIYASEDTTFEPASIDIHDAVCAEFKDLGDVSGPYGVKHQGLLVFQVEEENDEGNRKEVRFYFNMTLGTDSMPSNIRKYVEKWFGKEIDIDAGFDPAVLEGQACRLDVDHKKSQKGDRVYAKIDSIMKPGSKKLKVKNYTPIDEREQRNGEEQESKAPEEDDEIPF